MGDGRFPIDEHAFGGGEEVECQPVRLLDASLSMGRDEDFVSPASSRNTEAPHRRGGMPGRDYIVGENYLAARWPSIAGSEGGSSRWVSSPSWSWSREERALEVFLISFLEILPSSSASRASGLGVSSMT